MIDETLVMRKMSCLFFVSLDNMVTALYKSIKFATS